MSRGGGSALFSKSAPEGKKLDSLEGQTALIVLLNDGEDGGLDCKSSLFYLFGLLSTSVLVSSSALSVSPKLWPQKRPLHCLSL